MKTIVIAAGYATRLYPLTENFPKPLLQIGRSTILDRMLDDLETIDEIDEHIVVTNHKFAGIFEKWALERELPGQTGQVYWPKPIRIVDDGTETNETRLGAVRDLILALDECCVEEDVLVLAADNILDFSFRGFVEAFHEKGTSMIMCHYEPEVWKLQRTGVIAVDDDMKVLQMQEKPEKPVSHWAVPPFYIYRKEDLPIIRAALAHGCGADAPGNLARYMTTASVLHAWPMPAGRFDIGSLDTYEEAKKRYQ